VKITCFGLTFSSNKKH